jgi:hypothetical protein
MERRGIDELMGNGRSLRSCGVQKVTPHLRVQTLIILTLCRVEKSEEESENKMKYVK